MKTLVCLLAALGCLTPGAHGQNLRPNLLWLTSEDNGPQLGCYGDGYATTPNLDALARKGMIFLNAWSCGPVCAPARTAIISGLWPPATGSEHMRSLTRLPTGFKMYPQFLREAGYYCSNNSKEDYNLQKPGKVWDDSSPRGHWRNRQPGQPFFAIFNFTVSHESQVRKRPHQPIHDLAQVRVPAYHPDTPEVRRDWAQYYDQLTEMDALAGQRLRELAEAGLAEETIVFYYGDHGPGMPRCKRWPYNSGLQVPLIVYVPEKFRHLAPAGYQPGARSERLVSFLDLTPTLLSLVGIKPPEYLHGRALMGPYTVPASEYLYGFRGRMDERYDLVRSVRDQRYVYLRHYLPHLSYGQHVSYMFETPTTRIWKKLSEEGRLNPAQNRFWQTKPAEELYDLRTDRDEVNNLASSPAHREILDRLRKAQQDWAKQTRDVGFLPEGEIHERSKGASPYEMGHDDQRYPLERVLAMAELASALKREALPELQAGLKDADSAIRYWAVMGILMRGRPAVQSSKALLREAMQDSSSHVRIAAADALAQGGDATDLQVALELLVDHASQTRHSVYVALQAVNALDQLGDKARPVRREIEALPVKPSRPAERAGGYVARVLEHMLGKKLALEE